MERKGYIILVSCCAIGLALVTWASIVQARAAKNLEQQIAAGKIKIEMHHSTMPSAN